MTARTAVERVLAGISPTALREIACIREASDPARLARQRMTPEGVERLAEIYLAGSQPTVGFWRHELERQRRNCTALAAMDDAVMQAESLELPPIDLFEERDNAPDFNEEAA